MIANEQPAAAAFSSVKKSALPYIHAKITYGVANIISRSPGVFSYAHGTVVADGKIFIGMANKAGNPFPTNEVLIFDPADITRPSIVRLSAPGDIETMAYDALNDKIYFPLTGKRSLDLYSLDPHTYAVSNIIRTASVDIGGKPAIATDGKYIYGIANTDPSAVFKVGVDGSGLIVSRSGHIPNGHSAAIGMNGSTTVLYFGGGASDDFEKTDATTLAVLASIKVKPCSISNDMPFDPVKGYVYIGCETAPYGIRVNAAKMTYDRFSLPGNSLGVFMYGNDLYNAAQDGYIDIFKNGDLKNLIRYKVIDDIPVLAGKVLAPEVNEIFYLPESHKLYFTAWFGTKGLYQVSIM